ncbi:MAG: RNA polymerase sigma factor [Flavobacteriales bacterium]
MSKDVHKICNQKIFERIFKEYAKDLKRFIYFKTKDLDLTEDILQDTFVKLWTNCSKVNYHKVKSYLYTVANHTFLNNEKHKKVVQKHQMQLVRKSNQETPEFLFIEQEFLVKLEQAIANLPEKQREVFLLNRIEKKKYREIAVLLNVSVKTVEKRMHLALLYMKDKIGKV